MTSLNTIPLETVKSAVDALVAAREAARQQAHAFSAETWRSWRELEREIDIKLEDVQHRLALGGAYLAETVSARAADLHRAIDALLHEHSHPQARSIMTTNVVTCHPEAGLDVAARILWEADCGVVPVVDGERKVVGMITDRDICMAAFTRHALLSECTVASAMSPVVYSCPANAALEDVLALMSKHQVRRVPVVAPDGSLEGIISVADIARYLDTLPEEHGARTSLVPALAAIARRR